MKNIKNLHKNYKVALITLCFGVLGFIASSFLFSMGRMDIPLGVLIGAIIVAFLSFIQGLADKRDEKSGDVKASISVMIVRFILIIGSFALFGFMYYKWNIRIANIFCLVGIYSVSIIATIGIYLLDK